MATKQAKEDKGQVLTLKAGALTDIPTDDYADPEIVAINRIVEEAGDTSSVSVYRQGPGGYRDLTFLYACLPSEWIADGLQRIQRDYGKGIYRIHMKDENGAMVINRAMPVEAIPKRDEPAKVVAPAVEPAIAMMLQSLADGQRMLAEAIAKIGTQQPQNPLQTLEGIKAIAEIVKPAPVAASAPVAEKSGASSFMEMLTLVKAFNEAAAGVAPKALPVDENGKVDTSGMLLMEGVKMLSPLLGKLAETKGAPAQPIAQSASTALPALNAQPVAESGAEPEMTEEEKEQFMLLQLQLKAACRAASKNADPREYADSIYGLIPDSVLKQLQRDPNWYAYLCNIWADCKNYADWFANVRNELIAIGIEEGDLTAPEMTGTTAPLTTEGAQNVDVQGHSGADRNGTAGSNG